MTTPPDDPLLPHLALALDGPAMRRRFARPGTLAAGWTVQRCAIAQVSYRPQRHLAVAYQLELRHRQDGGALRQHVATRWCSGGESAQHFLRAAAARRAISLAGPSVTHDPALDLVAHWWPNDPRLATAAAALADPLQLRQRWLPEVARMLAAPSATLADAQVDIVRLAPGQQVTAQARMRLADGSTHTVYAKADADRRGPATQAAMQALWDSAARRGGRLVVPQPLGWQAGSGLHWQRALPGLALTDATPAQFMAAAARIGMLLGALHTTPVQFGRDESPVPPRTRLLELVKTLTLLDPSSGAALVRQGARLEPLLTRLFHGPWVTLHGDLHPRHVLSGPDGRPALIGLDRLRHGPALLDLSAWAAHVLHRSLLAHESAESCVDALREFMRGYRSAGGCAPAEFDWAAATAWQLLDQCAWRSATRLETGGIALVRPLVDTAQRLLAAGSLDAAAAPTCREAA